MRQNQYGGAHGAADMNFIDLKISHISLGSCPKIETTVPRMYLCRRCESEFVLAVTVVLVQGRNINKRESSTRRRCCTSSVKQVSFSTLW